MFSEGRGEQGAEVAFSRSQGRSTPSKCRAVYGECVSYLWVLWLRADVCVSSPVTMTRHGANARVSGVQVMSVIRGRCGAARRPCTTQTRYISIPAPHLYTYDVRFERVV